MGTISLNEILLPECYSGFEVYQSTLDLGPSPTHLCGVAITVLGGPQITASAAGLSSSEALLRATWELLERISIYEHLSKNPPADSGDRWALSRSSGVALYSDTEGAEARARLELLERHYVLKHWFLALAPQRLPWAAPVIRGYRLEAFVFHDSPFVVGVFAFPLSPTNPFVYGFASHGGKAEAHEKAYLETLQRLGFLYDEPIPQEPPDFEPSALYHQEFYLCPENRKVVIDWLAGELCATGSHLVIREYNEDQAVIEYLDITPDYFGERAVVVKATSPAHIPLVFGRSPQWDSLLPKQLQIHPIA